MNLKLLAIIGLALGLALGLVSPTSLNVTHGQAAGIDPSAQCIIYNTQALKVISLSQCETPFDAVAKHQLLGYKISGVNNAYVFMTK